MRIFCFIGPPSCGKGTQAKNIKNRYGVKHISTGTLIREEIKKENKYGILLKKYVDKRELIPDNLIQILLENIIINSSIEDSIIIDGFPRTVGQVDNFLNFLNKKNLNIEKMIILSVSEKELSRRKEKRRIESNRTDDKEEIQKYREIVYNRDTIPAIEKLKSRIEFCEILAEGTISQVSNQIVKCMEL
ncbi:MAG: nucleoside monophosphate kinase [Chitinophagales bacterium]